jgi:hypothetical protein
MWNCVLSYLLISIDVGNLDDVLRPQLNFALKSEVIVKVISIWHNCIKY